MKQLLTLSLSLLLWAPAFADTNDCQSQHTYNVGACTSSGLKGSSLAACLRDARDAKKDCKANDDLPEQCIADCQANHTTAVNQCEINFDPSLCGGDTFCEELVLLDQQNCKDVAQFELNSCISSCQ